MTADSIDDNALVSIRQCASLVGVSHTAIRRAIERGRITAIDETSGKLYRDAARQQWDNSHNNNDDDEADTETDYEGPKSGSWGVEYTKACTLLKREQRRKLSLERRELEGKLHRTEDVEAAWSEIVMSARAKLLALPAEIAGTLGVKLKRDRLAVQEILEREIERVLTELSVDMGSKVAEHRARRLKKSS